MREARRGGVGMDELPQPDPRPAILAFHRELAARGITLIVMPTPVKPAFTRRSSRADPAATGDRAERVLSRVRR